MLIVPRSGRPLIPAGAGRRVRRGLDWVAVVAAVSILLPASGCRFFSTPLSRVARDPGRFDGQDVTLAGRVEAVRWLPDTGVIGFRLSNGPDSILVLTSADPPAEGREVRLQGEIASSFPVEGVSRMVLFYRISRETRESTGGSDPR